MKIEDLEKRLDFGERFGCILETGNSETLGWVLLNKRKPATVSPFDAEKEKERFLNWKKESEAVLKQPYCIAIIEQQQGIYEIAEYESTEEFGLKENHYFNSLEEMLEFLESLGFNFDDIKVASEIGAP